MTDKVVTFNGKSGKNKVGQKKPRVYHVDLTFTGDEPNLYAMMTMLKRNDPKFPYHYNAVAGDVMTHDVGSCDSCGGSIYCDGKFLPNHIHAACRQFRCEFKLHRWVGEKKCRGKRKGGK